MDIQIALQNYNYDPLTGLLTWRISVPGKGHGSKRIGNFVNGIANKAKYYYVKVGDKSYLVHRVVWAMHYGKEPECWIDHINGDSKDNRIVNLREANRSQNTSNRRFDGNVSGYKGVVPHQGKFVASIWHSGKPEYIGIFENIEDAAIARTKRAIQLRGNFANREYKFEELYGKVV